MEFSEFSKTVFNRIQEMEPENFSKIIGYILRNHSEKEMIRLAFGPDNLIQSLINKVKIELNLSPKSTISAPVSPPPSNLAPTPDFCLQFPPLMPGCSRSFSSPARFLMRTPHWDESQSAHSVELLSPPDTLLEDYHQLCNQGRFVNLEDQFEQIQIASDAAGNYYPETTLALGNRVHRRTPSLPVFGKTCHYFMKGNCKHGSECRYSHGQFTPDNLHHVYPLNPNEIVGEDHLFSPASLLKLEMEIVELLKESGGSPISIASLPMQYYDKYAKSLQADGYLTESQRHGKPGHSLTKLLARLKNSIRIIDRPHGQHSIVLAEDAPRYMEYKTEKSDPGAIVVGSRQIYLTFPPESTFSESDVTHYFETYGAVQDVRIPCQQKRMFGFVTFASAETARTVLNKGNPHFVCGARVLVKPYREKTRSLDRKYQEKVEVPMHYPSHFFDMDPDICSTIPPRLSDSSRLFKKQVYGEREHALELERRHRNEFQSGSTQMGQLCYGYPIEDFKNLGENANVSSMDRFNYLFDALKTSPTNQENNQRADIYAEQDSQRQNLPESPFASSLAHSIPTVI